MSGYEPVKKRGGGRAMGSKTLRRQRDEWRECALRAHDEIRRLTAAIISSRPDRGSDLLAAIGTRYDFNLKVAHNETP